MTATKTGGFPTTGLTFDGDYLAEADWQTGSEDEHVWLDDDTRVTRRDLAAQLLDGQGNRTFRWPAALTYSAFKQREGYGTGVRWQDIKRWREDFLFTTALVRLARSRGCPVFLLSLTAPHRSSWRPSRAFWRAVWQEWRRSSNRVMDSHGAGTQLRFAEWSASFKHGVHRGYHVLVITDAEASDEEVRRLKQELCDLWVSIVERELDRGNAPDGVRVAPEFAAVATDFVDNRGRPYEDTSYFFKDRDVHKHSGPRRGSRGRRSYGIKDLEQRASGSNRCAAALLQEMREDMHRVHRLSLMDREWEQLEAGFMDALWLVQREQRLVPVEQARVLPIWRRPADVVRGASVSVITEEVEQRAGSASVAGEQGAGVGTSLGSVVPLRPESNPKATAGRGTSWCVHPSRRAPNGSVEHVDPGEMYQEWNRERTKRAREVEGTVIGADTCESPCCTTTFIDSEARRDGASGPAERSQWPLGAPFRAFRVVEIPVDSCGAQNRSERVWGFVA